MQWTRATGSIRRARNFSRNEKIESLIYFRHLPPTSYDVSADVRLLRFCKVQEILRDLMLFLSKVFVKKSRFRAQRAHFVKSLTTRYHLAA